MPTVFKWRSWNSDERDWRVQPSKATQELIRTYGGEAIPGTDEDVSDERLDPEGRLKLTE